MKINFDYYFEENTICNIFYSRRIKFECGGREKILKLANQKICFSKMTFPHQLIRIFLLEQIFRAFKISNR